MARVEVEQRAVSPMLEIRQTLEEAGGEELKNCYQCGTCTAVCPWGNLRDFSPRAFIEMARLGLEGFEEQAWTCVSCRRCQDQCPQEIDIPRLFQSVRSVLIEWKSNPSTLNQPLGSMRVEGNPWGEPKDNRDTWARKKEVPLFGPGVEHLLFTCCTNDYDARNRKDAQAAVDVLRAASVSFGTVGNEQRCCGDMAWGAGDVAVFGQMQQANLATLAKHSVTSMLTTSPHCLNAFKNRYEAGDRGRPVVRHVAELYAELVAAGALQPANPIAARVTYHDPCYLGRHNGVYDAPRTALRAIPGLELVEMANAREHSICCGGGGGGIWIETAKGQRLGDLRVRQAIDAGATIIATACPFCVQMLESSIMSFGLEEQLQVRTVSELLAESLQETKEVAS
jgi:Fe-S oxidoreductase